MELLVELLVELEDVSLFALLLEPLSDEPELAPDALPALLLEPSAALVEGAPEEPLL